MHSHGCEFQVRVGDVGIKEQSWRVCSQDAKGIACQASGGMRSDPVVWGGEWLRSWASWGLGVIFRDQAPSCTARYCPAQSNGGAAVFKPLQLNMLGDS
jgi:hypothetical protein